MNKPTAVASAYKCSVCDLDWAKHGEKPTLENCVALLKDEIRKSSRFQEFTSAPYSAGKTPTTWKANA